MSFPDIRAAKVLGHPSQDRRILDTMYCPTAVPQHKISLPDTKNKL